MRAIIEKTIPCHAIWAEHDQGEGRDEFWSEKRDTAGLALQLATCLVERILERETRFELATPTLARLCSTT
ncbi:MULTISPECIES: hypothetical protein, partial [Halomonadaceae]